MPCRKRNQFALTGDFEIDKFRASSNSKMDRNHQVFPIRKNQRQRRPERECQPLPKRPGFRRFRVQAAKYGNPL